MVELEVLWLVADAGSELIVGLLAVFGDDTEPDEDVALANFGRRGRNGAVNG